MKKTKIILSILLLCFILNINVVNADNERQGTIVTGYIKCIYEDGIIISYRDGAIFTNKDDTIKYEIPVEVETSAIKASDFVDGDKLICEKPLYYYKRDAQKGYHEFPTISEKWIFSYNSNDIPKGLEVKQAGLTAALNYSDGDIPPPGQSEPILCDDFKDDVGNIIHEIYKIMWIVVPLLLIGFGTWDFTKATLSSDDNALKKAGSDFFKRIIATVILFFIPLVIKLLLNVAYDTGLIEQKPDVCINE
jgi:hypothetical protein